MNLSQADKAIIYDNCIRESDQLQRRNSKIKSEYVGIPHALQEEIKANDNKINQLVKKLEVYSNKKNPLVIVGFLWSDVRLILVINQFGLLLFHKTY
jgi:hypothetical protein